MSKTRKIAYIVLALFAIVSIFVGTGAYAKYVKDFGVKQGVMSTHNFYFESDILTEEGATYELAPGTTSINFKLMNYADSLRYSDEDVKYTVTVTGGATVTVNGDILTKQTKSDETVTISGLTNGGTYTVTASATCGGFSKSLSATFIVKSEETGIFYNVETNTADGYILLTVWTKGVKGNVTIKFNGIPDNTDPIMRDVKSTDGSFTDTSSFNSVEYASRTYRFFGAASISKVTLDDDIVTATEKAIP